MEKFRNILNVSESFFDNKSTETNMENLFFECKKLDQIYSSKPHSLPKTPTVIFSLNKFDGLSTMDDDHKDSFMEKNKEYSLEDKNQILDKKSLSSGLKTKKLKIITKFETKERKRNGLNKSPKIKFSPVEFQEVKMKEIELFTK